MPDQLVALNEVVTWERQLEVREGHPHVAGVAVLHDEMRHRTEADFVAFGQIPRADLVTRTVEDANGAEIEPDTEEQRDKARDAADVLEYAPERCSGQNEHVYLGRSQATASVVT